MKSSRRLIRSIIFLWFIIFGLSENSVVAGSLSLSIFADDGGSTVNSLAVSLGDTVSLWTEVSTDLTIAGLSYAITMPTAGWILQSRDYNTHGWVTEDGVGDASGPAPSNLPQVIVANSDADSNPMTNNPTAALDFKFDSFVQSSGTKTGTFLIEGLSVTIPSDIPKDTTYSWNLEFFGAFNEGPSLIASNDVVIGNFTFQVIPEPSTYALMLMMFLGLAAYGRARRQRVVSSE